MRKAFCILSHSFTITIIFDRGGKWLSPVPYRWSLFNISNSKHGPRLWSLEALKGTFEVETGGDSGIPGHRFDIFRALNLRRLTAKWILEHSLTVTGGIFYTPPRLLGTWIRISESGVGTRRAKRAFFVGRECGLCHPPSPWLRPISKLRFWISEGLPQAGS